jgi:hypothetical protein
VRTVEERVADVRRLLDVALTVHADRARLVPAIARSSGLTLAGVELGFASLETTATEADLRSLVACAGSVASVHVVLSANVFVASLRAIALARAAAERVTVRPSSRDPVLARALVERCGDPAITLSGERDVGCVAVDEVHVYGRDATIAEVRSSVRPGVVVRGHGAGMGVAVISERADLRGAADALAGDVVAFDQRGCLSPRIAFVRGDEARADAFAAVLHGSLCDWSRHIPRGALSADEQAESGRWRGTLAYAGRAWEAEHHAVGRAASPVAVPPAGRHVLVVPAPSREQLGSALASLARYVVAVGTDDLSDLPVPIHARLSALGRMQRPPLDGPVDRRGDLEPVEKRASPVP